MTTNFRLAVLTPERAVLNVDGVNKVRLRLADNAWISVYPHHAPLIAETAAGALQYDTDTESGEIDLAPGILRIGRDEVLVLTSGLARGGAQTVEDGDAARFDRLAGLLMQHLGAASDAAGGEPGADDLPEV